MNADKSFNSRTGLVPDVSFDLPARRGGAQPSTPVKLLQCLLVAIMAYGSFFMISHYVLQSVQVVGTSMMPTLRPAERYLLNRFVYLVRDPQPNDIVVFRDPTDNSFAVKRIVAGEGDVVDLKAGRVYVNGRELREPYLAPGTPTYCGPTVKSALFACGSNYYFVMGDNRNNSSDSRIYGAVPRQNILGAITR